jgi:hypothetical protein
MSLTDRIDALQKSSYMLYTLNSRDLTITLVDSP